MPPAQAAMPPLNFTVNMNEAVTVNTGGGTPSIALDVGGVTRAASYASGTGTSVLTFTYTPVAGDVDLDGISISSAVVVLNGGTITDLNGNLETNFAFTAPNLSNVKVNAPSLSMDFIADADGRYTLNGTVYNDLASFLTAASGSFTRASTATYFDSAGTLQTVASGAPRFDYDPVTHVANGLLIESGVTNNQVYSQDLSQWNNHGGDTTFTTVTLGAGTAPDGTNTANLFSNSGQATTNFGKFSEFSGSNTTYTLSAWVKAGTLTTARLMIKDRGTDNIKGEIFPTLTSSWQRVSVTATTTGGATGFRVDVSTNGVTGNFYIWGAQVEQSSFPTSYIPTTSAAVTRQADALTIPTGAWFNASAGTATANAVNGITSSTVGIVSIDNSGSTGSNRMTLIRTGATSLEALVNNAAVTQFQTIISANGNNLLNKMGFAYAANNFREAVNGTLGGLDVSGTLPTVNQLRLGVWGGGTYYNGWVQKFKYHPLRVTDTQLQLLTQ